MGMKGFKGFEKDFSCGGKQCEENTTYEEYGEGCCYKGVMHFYEDPWEVLNHYDLVDGNGNLSEFAEVEALGQVWNVAASRADRESTLSRSMCSSIAKRVGLNCWLA